MTIDWNKDYYAILQVPRFSTAAELKSAYRNLAKKYHPDVNPGNKVAEEKFKEITNAYDVLSDAENKLIYDERLRNPYAQQQQRHQHQQRQQYEEFQRAQYEAFRRQQQRAREYREAKESENARPNYDISPWRVIFIVLIIINLLRMCTHRNIIP